MPLIDLSYEQVESLISEISLAGKLAEVPTNNGKLKLVFVSHCTGMQRARAEFEYDKAYEKALSDGFMTADETRALLVDKGAVPFVDELDIERLQSKIQGQEAYLSKLMIVPAKRERTIENINRMKKELDVLLNKKEEGLDYTAEKIAYEQKYLYMTWCGTKDPVTRELYWPTKNDFDNERDLVFRRELFLKTIKISGGKEVGILRYLARHNVWRIRYLTSVKTGESLFGIPILDYSLDQLMLTYWSQYYESIYGMLPEDRPSDSIIEDDAALDAYMKSYLEERNRESTSARESKNSGKGVKSAWSHEETLVMKSHPAYEDIEYSETVESVRNKTRTQVKPKNPKKR